MPTQPPITFTSAGLPADYCFTTFPRLNLDIVERLSGYVKGDYILVNAGSSEPAVDDRNKPWLRYNADGTPDRWYVYALGKWLWPHPAPANDDERRLWVGVESDLWSYDGGDGTNPSSSAPTDTTGAMWQVDADFAAKFLMAPGTLPSGTVVAVDGTGGEETTEITLTSANLPPHKHQATVESTTQGDDAESEQGRFSVGDGTFKWRSDLSGSKVGHTRLAGGTDGAAEEISKSNLPPYRAAYVIKRTSRVFYTV